MKQLGDLGKRRKERPLATKDSGITTSFSASTSGEFRSGDNRSITPDTMTESHPPHLEEEPSLTVDDHQLNEITNKILAQTNNKSITLAEAVAYDYLDLNDFDVVHSLGLQLDVADKMKKVFLPINESDIKYGHDYKHNIVKVQRSGETIAELDLADPNALEKINLPSNVVAHLQYAFEQPLNLREKQLKQLSDALERTGDLQFAISPLYPPFSKYWQEQQNDLSTSDSGYSMTTTSANDSSKQQQPQSTMVKIDFEPIVEPKIKSSLIETQTGVDLGSSTSDRDDGSEKIDLDKATVEQLDQYQLNQGLVQKIKQKDTGKDKTLGQQILDQEVNLDDINYLKQLNLDNRQANILKEFFFPTTHSKQTPKKRIISYSPEPGRFIELTTIYNQSIEHRGEGGADTKIIHIQEKQLSSVEHAMKRNVETEDPYYSQPHVSVSKQLPKTQPSTVSSHDEIKPPPIDIKKIESPIVHLKSEPVETKKRKSSGTGGLFACFGSKKSKSDTIRASTSGQAPVDKPTTPTASAPIFIQQTSASTIPPKSPVADCFLTKDGKRIYIDEYRERPGLDMSYVPPNFETNYFKPQVIKKQSLEYEEQFHALPATNDDNKTPEIEQTQSPPVIDIQQESAPQFPERSSLESASAVHLEPRQPTFEIVKTDKETKPVEEQILITTPPSQNTTTTSLHGAAVKLPVVDLQKPGPVEANLSSTKQEPIKVKVPKTKKEKSSTGGLCASCFGTKAKKQKQEGVEPKEKVKTDKKTSSEITRKDDDINKQHISPTVSVPKIDIKGPAVDIKPPTLPNIQTNLSSTTSPPPIDIETKIMDTAAFKSEDPHVDIDLNLKHDKTVPPLSTVSDKLANSVIPEFSINGPDLNLNVNKTEHSISSFEVPDLNIHVNTDKEVLPPTTTTFDVSDIKVPNVFDSEIIHDRDLRMGEIPDIKFYEQKQPTIDTVTDDINLKQQIPDYIVPSLPKVDIEDRTYDIPHVEADKTLISLPVAELPKLHIKGPDLDIHIENKKPEVRVETAELQGASGDFVVEAPTAELPKIDLKGPTVDLNLSGDSHKPITQTINIASQMPKVDVRDSAKGSYTLPTTVDETKSKKKKEKKEKKDKKDKKEKEEDNSSSSNGGLFGGFFKGKKSSKLTAPNVTLPSVDKSINIPPSLVISSDPLKVPSADLPKVKDVDFPTYDRPEVLATSKKNEFQVPSVSLPSIEGVNLPTQNIPDAFHFNRTSDQILQAPFTQLPDVEFTSNVPEKQIQEVPSTKSNMPIIEMGLPLATPIIDTTNQQLPNVNISKDFHFRTEESLDIDKPTTNALAKVNTPDSTVNLDKTILSSIESNYDIPSPAFRIDHKTEQIEALKPLDINFENPPTSSIASPELNVDIKHRDISPSFDIPDVDLNLNKSLAGPAPSSFDIPDVDLNLNKRSAAPAPPSFETDRSLTKPSISELIHDKNVQLGNIPDIKLYEQKQPTVSVKQTKVPDVPEIHLPKLDVTTDVKPVITKPQPIESAIHPPKKAKSGLCSCFGEKAAHKTTINKTETTVPKVKSTKTKIQAPVAKLPDVNLPALESTEVQKSKGKPLKAPVADLPPLDLKPPQSTDALLNTSLTKRPAPKLPDLPKPEIPKATKDLVIPDIGNIQTPSISEQIVPTDINISPIDQPEFKLRGPDILLESTTKPQLLSSHEAKYNLNDTHIVSESPEIKLKDIPSVPIGSVTTNVDYDIPKHINESSTEKQETHTHIKKGPSFEMKAPVMDIPDLDLKVSSLDESEANLSFKKHPQVSEEKLSVSHNIPSIPHLIDQHPHQQAPTTSRSDSGLEQIVSSHIHPSLTFGTDQSSTYDFSNSVSSGLGSEIIDGVAHKGYTLPSIKTTYEHPEIRTTDGKRLSIPTREGGIHYDFNKKITLNDDIHSKLVFRQQELKKLLETEISSTMDDFDGKKDHKHLQKIIQHSIDLIKDKKVSSYPELKTQLIMAHKNEAYIVDPVVKSLYLTIEKHNLDNIDRPEVALAIRDMVKDSAKQTINTITHLNTGTTNKPEPIQQSPPKQQPDTIPKLIVDSTKDARKIGEVVSKDVIPSIDVAPSQSQISATTTSTKEKQKSPIEKDDKHVAPKTPTAASSCLTCGRHPKSKSSATTTANVVDTKSATATGAKHSLLDERRHQQLNASKNELAATIREHIQSSSPPIKNMKDHSKDVDKIIRKTLQILVSPKVYSYEQVRNDLKTEYKQTFYLVDPIVDIVRDTLERCDIQNMQDKINVDILDANIKQTQELYNQTHGQQLLSTQELEYLQQNQTGFIKSIKAKEKEEKKINKKQEKELQKILERTCDILSTQQVHTWDEIHHQLKREYPKTHDLDSRAIELLKSAQMDGRLKLTEKARQTLVKNKSSIVSSIVQLLLDHNKNLYEYSQIEKLVNQTFDYLEQNNQNKEFRNYNDLKEKLKRDHSYNHDVLIEQIVDVIEQAHVTSQFEDMDKNEVQTLMKDRLHGNPLILKQIHVQLPPRQGAYVPQNQQQQSSYLNDVSGDSTHPSVTNGTNSHASRQIARGLSWREANERARILFYRGRHPAIHYDEKTAGFDVRMLLETQTGVQQEIPVTDEDVHRLLNTCGVQWDGINVVSLIDRSEAYVKEAERDALKLIKESGTLDQLKLTQQQQKINDEQQTVTSSTTMS
ncbi:unnamed protein product [Didymodactylos carnosus]|uniref:Uncharacterized protein n=1 Tax=Didymodactylos carnosus TaxID=1234261 RepID=A0A8S2CYQ3_9BILA|nr:unnamed protein product [Didymodactylos carnosus]CAF3620410.1 unnamed protein product [Didymodactylos carnosus]